MAISRLATSHLSGRVASLIFGVCLFGLGCQSTVAPASVDRDAMQQALELLSRPLSGDLGALYRLRVSSSGGLRLSVLTKGPQGRMTISEPFGSAVSLTAWGGTGAPEVFDLRASCRLPAADLSTVLGVGRLPLAQAVQLLGGRLPAGVEDRLDIVADARIRVSGEWGSGLVTIAQDPWRVISFEQQIPSGGEAWTVRLGRHTLSTPGWIRVEAADGRWAELELVHLEWDRVGELPALPRIPRCESGDRELR
jgi:hypothetical protein